MWKDYKPPANSSSSSYAPPATSPAAGTTGAVSPATTASAGYGNTYNSGYAVASPATTATASPATLPVSLNVPVGSYRPGSTSGSSVQSAGYNAPTYGNTYLR